MFCIEGRSDNCFVFGLTGLWRGGLEGRLSRTSVDCFYWRIYNCYLSLRGSHWHQPWLEQLTNKRDFFFSPLAEVNFVLISNIDENLSKYFDISSIRSFWGEKAAYQFLRNFLIHLTMFNKIFRPKMAFRLQISTEQAVGCLRSCLHKIEVENCIYITKCHKLVRENINMIKFWNSHSSVNKIRKIYYTMSQRVQNTQLCIPQSQFLFTITEPSVIKFVSIIENND